ncbi:MAG: hypothetical protein NWE98_03930 [Candidatus Bathyarchaeota archaeon]|nr:hypothetical protein [Candidatus Bathyarchaeota archaeon]
MVAIFTHAVATLGIFVLLGILVGICFMSKVKKVELSCLFKSSLLQVTIVMLVVMTLARWVYVAGVMESLIATIKSFTMELMGYRPEGLFTQYTPLYDQFVSPFNAYAWSIPVSMGSALILYYLISKKSLKSTMGVLVTSMYFAGSVFLLIGFIGGYFVSHVGFQRYFGYPSFIFLIPAAALLCVQLLKSSKSLGILIILLMIFQAGVAMTDPAISPQLYRERKSVDAASSKDYIETCFLSNYLPAGKSIVAPYEVLVSFNYLAITQGTTIIAYSGSLKIHRIMINKVVAENEVSQEIMYIWSPEIKTQVTEELLNVVYDSGRHIAFESG